MVCSAGVIEDQAESKGGLIVLANAHRVCQLGQPGAQPLECCLLQRFEIGGHFLSLRIIPLAKLGHELQQPRQTVRTLKAGAALSSEIGCFLRELACGQALAQSFACGGHECAVRKSSHEARQQPVPMYRRMPVVAAIKRRSQLARGSYVSITV